MRPKQAGCGEWRASGDDCDETFAAAERISETRGRSARSRFSSFGDCLLDSFFLEKSARARSYVDRSRAVRFAFRERDSIRDANAEFGSRLS
jgi:hypothetical protein